MRLLDQYLRLAEGLPTRGELPIADVAERLCCGERNARLLLQRMQAEGWLRWTPGRGRGRQSVLALLQEPQALRVRQLGRLLEADRLEAAFNGLPAAARARLKEALPAYLGATPLGGLRIPFYRPLHALDPIHVTRRTEAHVVGQVCETLTAFDREREAIVPALAHHWECDPGARRWTLWLRPGLRFHDGRPLRPHDAALSLRRLRDTEGPHRALLQHVGEVLADDRRVVLQLDAADHLLPHRLAHHSTAVLPEGDWQREDFASRPVGAGAFRIVRNNEHRASLRAFEGYWRERPLIDEIDLWVVPPGGPLPEADVRLGDSLRRHGPPAQWPQLQQAEQGCSFVLLNPRRRTFSSAAARLAVGRWLRACVASAGLPPHLRIALGWLPAWQHLPAPPRRPPAAPALPHALRLVTYELQSHIDLAHTIAQACRKAGSQVELQVLPYPVFAQRDWRDGADLVVAGEVLSDDLAFGQFSALNGESLFHDWLSAPLRRWLAAHCAAIAAEPSAQRRADAMAQAFERLTAEGAVLPMLHTLQQLEHAPHVGGVALARCGWMDFRKLWLAPADS